MAKQVYDVEFNGEVYEVEADSPEQAAAAFAPQQKADPQAGVRQFRQQQQFGAPEVSAEDAGNLGESLAEGGRRIVGNVKQGLGAVADFANQLFKGKSYYDPVTGQYADSSARRAATEQESARRQSAGELSPGQEFLAGTVESAPFMVAGGVGPLARAESVTGAMLKNSSLGALEAGLQFDDGGDWANDMLIAGGGTAAFTGATAAIPGAANMIRRGIRSSLTNPRVQGAVNEARDTLGDFAISLAQRTGMPIVRTLERASYNEPMQEFYAAQTDDIVNRVAKELNQNSLGPGTLESNFDKSRATIQAELTNLYNKRDTAWEQGLAKVAMKGGSQEVQTPNLFTAIDKVRRAAQNPLINLTRDKLPGRVINSLTTLQTQAAQGRQPTVGQVAALLQGLTGLQKEADPVKKALANELRTALDADLRAARAASPPNVTPNPLVGPGQARGPGDALQELLDVRQAYAENAQKAMLVKNGATYNMLGANLKKGEIPPPEQLMDNFYNLKPTQQVKVRSWMARNTPDTLAHMRQAAVDQAVAKSRAMTAATDSEYSLDALERSLFDVDNGSIARNRALFTPTEQRKLDGIRSALRVVKGMRPPSVGAAGTPLKPEDVAINAVSWSGPFVARQITRALTGANGHKFLTDDKVYTKLLTMANTRGPSQDVARESLVNYLQDAYPEDEAATAESP